jgi:hypothetical protein
MNISSNLEMYRNIDAVSTQMRRQIAQLEQQVDEFCSEFVKTQEDLQMVSFFTSMLNDLHSDLEKLDDVRGVLYN